MRTLSAMFLASALLCSTACAEQKGKPKDDKKADKQDAKKDATKEALREDAPVVISAATGEGVRELLERAYALVKGEAVPTEWRR